MPNPVRQSDGTCSHSPPALNGVAVTCTVAPALVFFRVSECDNTWEDQTTWSVSAQLSGYSILSPAGGAIPTRLCQHFTA